MSRTTHLTTVTPMPASMTREHLLAILHDHEAMIRLDPYKIGCERCAAPATAPPEERACAWYQLTERVDYLPNGLLSGTVSFTACFHDLPDGLQTHVYAPAGLTIRGRWTIGGSVPGERIEPRELGIGLERGGVQGLYLREDAEVRCNVLLWATVKKNLKRSHGKLVEKILESAPKDAGMHAGQECDAPRTEQTTEQQTKWPLSSGRAADRDDSSKHSTTASTSADGGQATSSSHARHKSDIPGHTYHSARSDPSRVPAPLIIKPRSHSIASASTTLPSPLSMSAASNSSFGLSPTESTHIPNFSRPTSQHFPPPAAAHGSAASSVASGPAVSRPTSMNFSRPTSSHRGRQLEVPVPLPVPSSHGQTLPIRPAMGHQRARSTGHTIVRGRHRARHGEARTASWDPDSGGNEALFSTSPTLTRSVDSGIMLSDFPLPPCTTKDDLLVNKHLAADAFVEWARLATLVHEREGRKKTHVRGSGPRYTGSEIHPALRGRSMDATTMTTTTTTTMSSSPPKSEGPAGMGAKKTSATDATLFPTLDVWQPPPRTHSLSHVRSKSAVDVGRSRQYRLDASTMPPPPPPSYPPPMLPSDVANALSSSPRTMPYSMNMEPWLAGSESSLGQGLGMDMGMGLGGLGLLGAGAGAGAGEVMGRPGGGGGGGEGAGRVGDGSDRALGIGMRMGTGAGAPNTRLLEAI